jgi:transcription initiation factor TFIIH subunit 3
VKVGCSRIGSSIIHRGPLINVYFTDDSNLLVTIIDTNVLAWQQSTNAEHPLSLDDAVRQILLFFNAHMAFKHDNRVAALASHIGHW